MKHTEKRIFTAERAHEIVCIGEASGEKRPKTINVNNKRCLNTNAQTNMDRGAKHYVLKRVINQRINAIKIFMHTQHIRACTRTLSQPLVHSLPIAGLNWIFACMWRLHGSVFDCAVIAFVAICEGPSRVRCGSGSTWMALDAITRGAIRTRAQGESRSAHGARRDAQPRRAGRERDRSGTRRVAFTTDKLFEWRWFIRRK